MKMLLKSLLTVALLATGTMAAQFRSGTLANETGLAYNKTYSLDLDQAGLRTVSVQTVYSTVTIPAATFTDGAVSTGQITVNSTAGLVGVAGTNTLTIVSNTLPSTARINLNRYYLTIGTDWLKGTTAANTAINIKVAINARSATYGVTASTTSSNVVTLTCSAVGVDCNSKTLSVNTSSITAGGANFSGGVMQAVIAINAVPLVQGRDWTRVATASGTAKAISDAIMASSSLNTVLASTWTAAGVVYTTSTYVGSGVGYSMFSSTQAALTIAGTVTTTNGKGTGRMSGQSATAIDTTANTIAKAAHKFTTALPVLFATVSGTAPAGLTAQTTYYAIPVDANSFRLASTSTGAIAGVPVSITAQTGSGSFSLTPLAYTGTPSMLWEGSNDGTNWLTIAVPSVTYSAPASALWDLGEPGYRYIRLNVTAPTTGAMSLVATYRGRSL